MKGYLDRLAVCKVTLNADSTVPWVGFLDFIKKKEENELSMNTDYCQFQVQLQCGQLPLKAPANSVNYTFTSGAKINPSFFKLLPVRYFAVATWKLANGDIIYNPRQWAVTCELHILECHWEL